ncbi:MAG: hypothetical protein ACKOF9_04585, partial [Burkholderiales bacterium]
ASTPALIRCAMSTFAGSVLRVLAIIRIHQSLDGCLLSDNFNYLNSIASSPDISPGRFPMPRNTA